MRTTLSLDDDVAALLKRVRKNKNASLKEVVNTALREGLTTMTMPSKPRPPFRTESISLGRCHVANLDDISDVLAAAEGEHYK